MIRRRISIDGVRIEKRLKTDKEADEWLKSMIKIYSDKPLKGEIWKIIPNFSKYRASNFGRVASINYKKTGMFKVLSPAESNKGYMSTMLLRDDGIYNSRPIHRLIAAAFLGLKKDLTVNHKDGIKKNNNIDNLEWCTRAENCQHAVDTGLWEIKSGEKNGMAKLTNKQVRYARKQKQSKGRFWGRNELAKKWGINPKHLQRIVKASSNSWPEA